MARREPVAGIVGVTEWEQRTVYRWVLTPLVAGGWDRSLPNTALGRLGSLQDECRSESRLSHC
jgi:hypothetical protein